MYNRAHEDVSQDDLARISHISKLIGSTLIKCDYFAQTLQTILGLNLLQKSLNSSLANSENMYNHLQENANGPL